jgi:predicted transcriptional regulator
MSEAQDLSRRERQIMDSVYRRGKATAAEVMADLPEAPSYSAVRTMLRLLEDKGHLRHEQDGPRYVYVPMVARENARVNALKHLVSTFFNGSAEQAMAALLEISDSNLSDDQLGRLQQLIEDARTEGR